MPGGGGINDGEGLLDYLAEHPSTAAFISRKLCVFLVADNPDQGLVDSVNATYQAGGGDIREMLRTLFAHPAFAAAQGGKFKRPQRLLAGYFRLLSAYPSSTGWRVAHQKLMEMRHAPYAWPAPDGYPAEADYWMNSNGMLQRWNLASSIALAPSSSTGIDWAASRRDGETVDSLTTWRSNELAYPLTSGEHQAIVTALEALLGNGVLGPQEAEAAARHIVYLMLADAGFQQH